MAQLPNRRGFLLVQFVDLYGNEIVASGSQLLRTSLECCDELCNGIGHATKHLFDPTAVNNYPEIAT